MKRHLSSASRAFSVPLAFLAACAQGADCKLEEFGASAIRTCLRTEKGCLSPYLPSEVLRIQRGVYTEYIGMFVNEGIANWIALDIDAGAIVSVIRYAGRRLPDAPSVGRTSPDEFVRETTTPERHWIEHVRTTRISVEKVVELACMAQPLWSEPNNLIRFVTDSASNLVLTTNSHARSHGGPGLLRDRAEQVSNALRQASK